jgi:hypothetical protein
MATGAELVTLFGDQEEIIGEGYGVEIPLLSPAYRYAKRVLKAPLTVAEGIAKIPEAATKQTSKIATGLTITLVLVGLGVAGYLIFAGRKGTKLVPMTGRRRRRR